MDEPFVLGVNYWPRRKAMYWWSDFDAGEVREEFALLKELGLSLIRIFLLWDDFQPTPDMVTPERLADLTTVCDIAADLGLKLDVTFFTGHMSGPNWSPGWLLDPSAPPAKLQVVSGKRVVQSGYRNPYHDPIALQAEDLLLRTVVGALRDHSAIGMWNLGNEPDLFAWPNSAPEGQAWVRDRVAVIRSIDPTHPITCGLHVDSLHRDNGLRVDQVFAETDVAVMHAYPMYLNWSRSPLDPDLVPFTCAFTTALCGKPTLMEEFGGCTAAPGQPSETWSWTSYGKPRTQFMASEEELATYISEVLPRLVEVGATGALLWCFADYVPELWDRPPCDEARHERFFGLVRPDGSLKPHAEALRAFAKTQPKVLRNPTRRVTNAPTPDEFYANPVEHLVRCYQQFVD
jgi:endo-1,4-beta-mannosidase